MASPKNNLKNNQNNPNQNPNYIWWKHGVIYQIYPRSFKDTNNDGIGDIRGIIEKLDYLVDLGIDAIWLTPCFLSPMVDFGYDVADYKQVDPIFGTNADLDELIEKAHQKGIKIVLDLVLNHSSNQHQWFKHSQSSVSSPYRNYYIWKPPRAGTITKTNPKGQPPNNWLSVFNGPAWTFDEQSGEYYFHSFLPEQPDFNWRNPVLESELLGIISYWLDKGADGFRLDALNSYLEDLCLRDNPENPFFDSNQDQNNQEFLDGQIGNAVDNSSKSDQSDKHSFVSQSPIYTTNQAGIHDLLQKFRKLTDDFEQKTGKKILLLGEIGAQTDAKNTAQYYGQNNNELHLTSNFDFTYCAFEPAELRQKVEQWESLLPSFAFPHYTFGNHDIQRMVSRHSPNANKSMSMQEVEQRAILAATFLLTIRGVPIIYYGEEIGMEEKMDLTKEQIQDPFGKRNWPEVKGRDGCRTPMQWDNSINAGFTTASNSWLPLHSNYPQVNVENQQNYPFSVLNSYQKIIQFRQQSPAILYGDIKFLDTDNSKCLAYTRTFEGHSALVLLNFTSIIQNILIKEISTKYDQIKPIFQIPTGTKTQNGNLDAIEIPAYGCLIFGLESAEPNIQLVK